MGNASSEQYGPNPGGRRPEPEDSLKYLKMSFGAGCVIAAFFVPILLVAALFRTRS